jgi:surface antigen
MHKTFSRQSFSRPDAGTRRKWLAVAVVSAAAGATAGCGTTGSASGELAGFAAGSAAGALTANPFVAVATGLAVRFATSEAETYLDRRRQAAIHGAIATAAGSAAEGEIVPWSVAFDIPPRQVHGQVQTVRALGGRIACREVLYNIKSGGAASYFVGVVCRHQDGAWRWAVSEPTAQAW